MTYLLFSKRPFLFIVIPLLLGVCVGDLTQFIPRSIQCLLILFSIGLFVKDNHPVRRLHYLFFTFLCIGSIHYSTSTDAEVQCEKLDLMNAVPVLIQNVQKKKNKYLLTGVLNVAEVQAQILIHLKDTCEILPGPGSIISLSSVIVEPDRARVPGGFDYRKYLLNKNIQFVSYPRCHNVVLEYEKDNWIRGIGFKLNAVLLDKIDSIFSGSQSKAVVKGILLGFKDDMESSDRQMYSSAGIGHVFAVSGMHVGMVYLFCWPLLFFRSCGPACRIIMPIVLMVAVWLFILASGSTPSAIRAGLMITLYELGRIQYRQVDKWNILAFTAFLAICFNAHVIFEIGFQFSYLALIGIITFYPIASNWFKSKNILLRWAYSTIVLSVSAQLTLLPLSLYYFGNMSPYFWLSSLVAMFVVQVNFVLSGVSLMLPDVSILTMLTVDIINYLFTFLNDFIKVVMTFPYASVFWKPSSEQLYLGYFLLIGCVVLRVSKLHVKVIKTFLVALLVFFGVVQWLECGRESTELLVFANPQLSLQLKTGKIRQDIQCDHLNNAGFRNFIGNISVSIVDASSKACQRDAELLLIKEEPQSFDFLSELRSLNHVILCGRMNWRKLKYIKDWCAKNQIRFSDTRRGYVKIKL